MIRSVDLVADLPDLATLESRCLEEPWSAASLESTLGRADARAWIDRGAAGEPAGYVSFLVFPGGSELLRIAVAPAFRRRGIATALLEAGLAGAGTPCHLEVREDATPARSFYERTGFRASGRRVRYYRDGTDAILYTRSDPAAVVRDAVGC